MPYGESWLHKLRSGPNPVYSPEILFFVAITAVSALACPCRYASVGIECRPLHAIGGRES
jgi:hypothetical protein